MPKGCGSRWYRATRICRSWSGRGDVYWDYSDAAEYGYEQIAARFGVAPERMADYLALAGDAVDNIPGVPGIGPKTAAALMSRFASLEEMYEDLDQRRRICRCAARRGCRPSCASIARRPIWRAR